MAELQTRTDSATGFDPEKAVADYRLVMAGFESETGSAAQEDFRSMSKWLRQQWQDWQGEDSLHEMSFGEPVS